MINEVPTVFEVVTGTAKKPSSANQNGNRSKPCYPLRGLEPNFPTSPSLLTSSIVEHTDNRGLNGKNSKTIQAMVMDEEEGLEEEEEEKDEDQDGETLCGACGDNYGTDEFWICCDMCERWFHGTCVKITPARAEHIKHYKCASCSNKRARP